MIELLRKIKSFIIKSPSSQKPKLDYTPIRVANEFGWYLSREKQMSIDKNGNPLPWITYPAIEYLNQLDLSDKNILEYGSGNSSLFFSERAKKIISIEHNHDWFQIVNHNISSNQKIYLAEEKDYSNFPLTLNEKFDLIIIDGIQRKECVDISFQLIAEGGIILLDNSERYPDLCSNFRENNFFQIDFHGMSPINRYCSVTSLFITSATIGKFHPKTIQPLKPKAGEML